MVAAKTWKQVTCRASGTAFMLSRSSLWIYEFRFVAATGRGAENRDQVSFCPYNISIPTTPAGLPEPRGLLMVFLAGTMANLIADIVSGRDWRNNVGNTVFQPQPKLFQGLACAN